MRKLWIGVAAGCLVPLAAVAWLGGAITATPAASAGREAAVPPLQQDHLGAAGNAPASKRQREKQGRTADPLPRAEDKEALLRLFLLLGLARKQ